MGLGDELAPVSALPRCYVWNGLLDTGTIYSAPPNSTVPLDDIKGFAS